MLTVLIILAVLAAIIIPVFVYKNNQKKIDPVIEKVETVVDAVKAATK